MSAPSPTSSPSPSGAAPDRPLVLGVIGRGRAARALVPRWLDAGHGLAFWYGRADGPIEETPSAPPGQVDLLVIAVSDSALAEVAQRLAMRPTSPAETWIHLSGVHPASILRVSETVPAHVGGLHPLVALAEGSDPRGATAGLEGDEVSLPLCERLARDLGLNPVVLADPSSRALYHAAAVTVAGQATALFSQAIALMGAAKIPPETARAALQPLLVSAARNLGRLSPADALTGPIARGDVSTIQTHLAAIERLPAEVSGPIAETYRLLARAGLELVADRLPTETLAALTGLLAHSDRPDREPPTRP